MKKKSYGITCKDESLPLSSEIEFEAWKAIEDTCARLLGPKESTFLFAWKDRVSIASMKEVYAWRRAIERIKEARDLYLGGEERPQNTSNYLQRSRPIMLRLAGEITNALIHSNERNHKVEFVKSGD